MTHLSSKLNIICSFKGFDSSEALREYAEKRVMKLDKLTHQASQIHFVFLKEKLDCVAQLHVNAGDFEARAEARNESFYAAVDEVTDKILHQSRKHKEKSKERTGRGHHNVE